MLRIRFSRFLADIESRLVAVVLTLATLHAVRARAASLRLEVAVLGAVILWLGIAETQLANELREC